MSTSDVEVTTRLRLVQEEITLAAEAAGRDPDSVKLVAVTKTVAQAVIANAASARTGCRRRMPNGSR